MTDRGDLMVKRVKVSNNVIRRLPRYLRKLDELQGNGINRISSFELGQQLGEVLAQVAAVVDVYVVAVKDLASGSVHHSVAGVCLAVVVERCVLVVKTQACSEGETLPVDA